MGSCDMTAVRLIASGSECRCQSRHWSESLWGGRKHDKETQGIIRQFDEITLSSRYSSLNEIRMKTNCVCYLLIKPCLLIIVSGFKTIQIYNKDDITYLFQTVHVSISNKRFG